MHTNVALSVTSICHYPQSAQHWRDEVASLYEKATTGLLKNNLLLHFAFADYEESRMKSKECHEIYKNLLSTVPDPTLVSYIVINWVVATAYCY